MINPYDVIRVTFWICVFICLFIALVALVYIIEYGSESFIINILANITCLGIISIGMVIADNAVMYQIASVERNNSNDEISGSQNITAFINKQIYLFPLYIYIAIFAVILTYLVLYILGNNIVDKVPAINTDQDTDSTHNLSKIINATFVSMCIIVPIHFVSVFSYQILRGKQSVEQLEHVKNNHKKIKHLTMLLVGVSIFFLLFNMQSFLAWSNLQKIPYIKQGNFELSNDWTSLLITFTLFMLVAFVQNLTRTMN